MVMRFLNSNTDMLSLDTLISMKKCARILDQLSTKQTELLLYLVLQVRVNQQL